MKKKKTKHKTPDFLFCFVLTKRPAPCENLPRPLAAGSLEQPAEGSPRTSAPGARVLAAGGTGAAATCARALGPALQPGNGFRRPSISEIY